MQCVFDDNGGGGDVAEEHFPFSTEIIVEKFNVFRCLCGVKIFTYLTSVVKFNKMHIICFQPFVASATKYNPSTYFARANYLFYQLLHKHLILVLGDKRKTV